MILAIVPTKAEVKTEKALDQIKFLLQRYFMGLILQLVVMFVIYSGILNYFDVNYALTIAMLCAILNLIPYLGPVIGFFIIIGLTMNSLFGVGESLTIIILKIKWIAGLYLIAQVIDNYINQPIIYSKSVKSHPLEIFIVTIMGGFLYGVIGVFIAIPFYTIVRVILKEFFSEFKLVKSITKDL
jgi:predicted PurR-regulated permease PerM